MTPEQFVQNEYRDYVTYRELARIEPTPEFKRILEELVEHEKEDFEFWRGFLPKREYRLGVLEIPLLKLMRKVLGLTFTAKFLERHEKEAVRGYSEFLRGAEGAVKARVEEIIRHERLHEGYLIGQIREDRVKFLGSVVLGLNDGLIELTGALTGFAFALRNSHLVALFGLVTGIAATLSMTSSAYMQARHDLAGQARHEEGGRDPRKAALYTGASYLAVVSLLVLPFFLIPAPIPALAAMLAGVVLLIGSFSYYSSVLFDRSFKKQFGEMLLFSLGVAAVAFGIGSLVRPLIEGLAGAHPVG